VTFTGNRLRVVKRVAVVAVLLTVTACSSSPTSAPTPSESLDPVCAEFHVIISEYLNAGTDAFDKYKDLPSQLQAANEINNKEFFQYLPSLAAINWPKATSADLKDVLKHLARNQNPANEATSLITICHEWPSDSPTPSPS